MIREHFKFMNKDNVRIIYTIFVFVALAAFDNIIIGLFPPLFLSISKDLNITLYSLGGVSAINILVTAVSSILWGYAAGRYNRKRLIMFGTVIWSVSIFFTARSNNYFQLLISQLFTGIGLGCISSIGFSVLTDLISHKYRGMLLSLWGISQGFGGIFGSLMASIVVTASNWRRPFEIVSLIGMLLTILYVFVKEPVMGGAEPELKKLAKSGNKYKYSIRLNEVKHVLLKKTNLLLLFQSIFMNITTGSLIWLPTLYISRIRYEGYDNNTAIIAAGYLYAILQLGGLSSVGFGYLGDLFQRKSYKGRAIITSLFVFITMPLYIIMFMVPMKGLLIDNSNTYTILISLLKEIFINPWMIGIFFLALFASAAQSANTPNWLAIITEANLPEHRGVAFSMASLANSFGRTIGNVGVGYVLALVSIYNGEPNNYVITMIFFQIFLIPAAAFYLKIGETNVNDIKEVKNILRRRGQNN